MSFKTRDRLYEDVPTVYVMVGMSRCGKSTWANKKSTICSASFEKNRVSLGATIVCRDDVRRSMGIQYDERFEPSVKMVAHYMAAALIERRHDIIIDDTNLTVASRSRWVQMSFNHKIELIFVVLPSPAEAEWKRRCEVDQFSWEVIMDQVARYQPLQHLELEAAVQIIKVKP